MEWVYLLMAYLPFICLLVGAVLLITGLVLQKSSRNYSKTFFIAGGLCFAICLLIGISLFLVGIFGIGPVPN